MSRIRCALVVWCLPVAAITAVSLIPTTPVYGQRSLGELVLLLAADDARPPAIGRPEGGGRVRLPLQGKNFTEYTLRSAMARASLEWTDTGLGYALQRIGLGPVAERASDTQSASKSFATDFPLTERPISENGVWHHVGTSWTVVRSVANHAVGTQTGSAGYDDSYAYLSGFGPDQEAQATLWIDPAAKGDFREVELLLRWADSPTNARGYECNLSWNGSYAEIVRWNGPYGDFTYITKQTRFKPGIMPPRSGDIFKAAISESTIHVYLNKHDGKGDQLIVGGSDRTFADGQPGMGFFIRGNVDPTQFGFSSYAASSD